MTPHEKQILADWASHPGWEVWNRHELERRDEYMGQLARKLFSLPADSVVDQQDLAFQRGRWRGRREQLNEIRLCKPKPGEDDSA